MTNHPLLVYGAYGYTGRLCVERALARGHRPLLVGRDAEKLAALGAATDLDHVAYDLDKGSGGLADIVSQAGVQVVLHCAGPFAATWRRVLDACTAAKAHYLDVTGEIAVFEGVLGRAEACRDAGIAAVPGVGFDVVPTDCLAAELAHALPDADRLELAFAGSGGGVSRGTARTIAQGLGHGGAARIDGRIVKVPHVWRQRRVDIGGRERTLTSVGWGDVSTAYHTTGIPNIVTYTAIPHAVAQRLRWANRLGWLLRRPFVQRRLRRQIDARIVGPSADERRAGAMHVWGRVESPGGEALEGRLSTPEGYEFTARAAIAAVERLLDGGGQAGAWTPAQAFGRDFVRGIEGVRVEPLEQLP